MRMVLQGARPGMQHGEDAQRAADPLAIRGERLDRRGGFTKQGGIDEPLVRASHRPELVRQREREEVMIARQQSRAKAGEPILSPILLALGGSAGCDTSGSGSRARRSRHSGRAIRRGPRCGRRQSPPWHGGVRATSVPRGLGRRPAPLSGRCPPAPASCEGARPSLRVRRGDQRPCIKPLIGSSAAVRSSRVRCV